MKTDLLVCFVKNKIRNQKITQKEINIELS